MGALVYADDIFLLSPTIFGLKSMMKESETFATEHSLMFNLKKTQVISFSTTGSKPPKNIAFGGVVLDWRETVITWGTE